MPFFYYSKLPSPPFLFIQLYNLDFGYRCEFKTVVLLRMSIYASVAFSLWDQTGLCYECSSFLLVNKP